MTRFWDKVYIDNSCWEWIASKNPDGYGNFYYNKRIDRAHRVSYILEHGPIPKGMLVCHNCDNPGCVNPSHLFLGSQKDNMSDCSKKRRIFNSNKTHCKHGHEFTPENTIDRARKIGGRKCRQCQRDQENARNLKKRMLKTSTTLHAI